jgi:GT2 family glycosyltransferase
MLSISVAVYNLPAITRRCFESLDRTLAGVPFEVLVHDNHSTDPAMDALYAPSIRRDIGSSARRPTSATGARTARTSNGARANGS